MKLGLKSKKMSSTGDKYQDSLGWSSVGRTLDEAPKPEEPSTITIQCEMCGSMLTATKPRNARYVITCEYPICGHENKFG